MRRVYITTVLTSLAVLMAVFIVVLTHNRDIFSGVIRVGFIYEDDESLPYTYNFARAEEVLQEDFGKQVEIISRSNVPEGETEEPLRELIRAGCRIIFTNSHSADFLQLASDYPRIQFCQVSYLENMPDYTPPNYHTFKGEIYQGRYLSGIAAGMKLKSLIDRGVIESGEGRVGFVAANSSAAVISGYTAFLLGVRSVVPDATMRVCYTNTWGNYRIERDCTRQLIDEGCIVISQHSDTIGPAVACEEAAERRTVYFIGYNQSMLDVAPTTALISTRINWVPYIEGAVRALMEDQTIEETVDGNVHGNDMSAGIEREWVQLLELNTHIAAKGTAEALDKAAKGLTDGSIQVFSGDYQGVNPLDPEDTIDLNEPFIENEKSSSPTFHYVLKDVITIEGAA